MSLQVWLPLNGNLNNLGLGNVTITSTNTPDYRAAGKIGPALELHTRITFSCPQLALLKTFSICFWARSDSSDQFTGNWQDVFGFTDLRTDNVTGTFRCETGYNQSYIQGLHWHDNSTYALMANNGSALSGTCYHTNNKDEWHHCSVIFNNSDAKIYFYTDGQWIGTYGHAGGSFNTSGSFFIGETNVLEGAINDVRIYDHALSAKEVKKIARGLMLHYPLNELTQMPEKNLMPNHLVMNLGSANPSTGTWRLAGSNTMTKSRVFIADSPEGECYGFQNSGIQTPNDGSCYGIDNFPLKGNTTYTISMWARITEGTEGYAGYNIYSIATEKGGSHSKTEKGYRVTTLPLDGSWVKCWYTFTTNASNTRNIYIGITTGDTSVTTQMCCIHIEEVRTIIHDISGFKNHGTITGNLTAAAGSPRYKSGILLSKAKISSNTGFPSGTDPNFTVCFWVKIFSNITYVSYGDLIGMADGHPSAKGQFRLELCGSPAGNNLMWFRGPSGQATGGFNMKTSSSSGWFSKDTWHHIALVGNGATKQYTCYLDGAQCGTFNGSSYSWIPTGNVYIGDSGSEATASFSDLRVYTTVLSANDILELYQLGKV